MSDLISRSVLKEQFANECLHNCYYCKLSKWDKEGGCYNCGLIDNAPTVEPERPQGEWKFKKFDEKTGIPNSYWCPFCGMVKAQVYDNFCGNCGADMRGDCDNPPMEYFENGGI